MFLDETACPSPVRDSEQQAKPRTMRAANQPLPLWRDEGNPDGALWTGKEARGTTKGRLDHKDLKGSQGPKGEEGTALAALHLIRQENCGADFCTLKCSAGERIASVSCPGGTFTVTDFGEGAACANSQGTALAICVRP